MNIGALDDHIETNIDMTYSKVISTVGGIRSKIRRRYNPLPMTIITIPFKDDNKHYRERPDQTATIMLG